MPSPPRAGKQVGDMRVLTKLFVSMTITGAAAVTGLAAVDVPALLSAYTQRVEVVAAQRNCRAVDYAILAYTTNHDRIPTAITQLQEYESVDFTAYRIKDGRATGPGCADPAR